ncbi:putative sugar phosphate/phosphate translocator [Auxenochlorella protothecoides]|uniref:Putative sugar phosphate/phosphate translocator n=1 Tax=Auxenochlorella protothecoides TaxID=3075 RepID=A0A087S9M6_AUXPR|nr:putative sugar phosphate/phosphate translocator [Auxenochlorella protothecoides]KFM22430.1 putative sugar phosphate/phosphate translocator [Auxenochlorella protothecoides]
MGTPNPEVLRAVIRLLAFAGFPFPIALTMWHMAFCSAVGFFCIRVLGVTKTHNLSVEEYCRRVLPIGALPMLAMRCYPRGRGPVLSCQCPKGDPPLVRPVLLPCACFSPHHHTYENPALPLPTPPLTSLPPPNPFHLHPGMLYAASLWLSNSSYLYLSVSFIQMTKSLMPGLVYACGVALGTETFAAGSALNMLLIAAGVVVCAVGEANLVVKGLVQQLAALLFEVGSG